MTRIVKLVLVHWLKGAGSSGYDRSVLKKAHLFFYLMSLTRISWSVAILDLSPIESKLKVHLGVSAIRGDRSFGYRENERFAFCSTFKWILGALVLKKVEEGHLCLERKIRYEKKDLLSYSPVTSQHLADGAMSVGDLCAATIESSDNTAANLLFSMIGGTIGLQAFVRSLGDRVTRFDRKEPDLNSNEPNDPRDTITPKAMTFLLREVLSGGALQKSSQEQLRTWMRDSTTGLQRLRAGVPPGWIVGNKTGSGAHGAVNDVGFILPPQGLPIYISIFSSGEESGLESHESAIAEATKTVLKYL